MHRALYMYMYMYTYMHSPCTIPHAQSTLQIQTRSWTRLDGHGWMDGDVTGDNDKMIGVIFEPLQEWHETGAQCFARSD